MLLLLLLYFPPLSPFLFLLYSSSNSSLSYCCWYCCVFCSYTSFSFSFSFSFFNPSFSPAQRHAGKDPFSSVRPLHMQISATHLAADNTTALPSTLAHVKPDRNIQLRYRGVRRRGKRLEGWTAYKGEEAGRARHPQQEVETPFVFRYYLSALPAIRGEPCTLRLSGNCMLCLKENYNAEQNSSV